jgi:hypothetical protein
MEDLLREAFQLGQQWVQDMSNDKEPTDFNSWYNSNETQEKVKNCSIPDAAKQSGECFCQRELGTTKEGKCLKGCYYEDK